MICLVEVPLLILLKRFWWSFCVFFNSRYLSNDWLLVSFFLSFLFCWNKQALRLEIKVLFCYIHLEVLRFLLDNSLCFMLCLTFQFVLFLFSWIRKKLLKSPREWTVWMQFHLVQYTYYQWFFNSSQWLCKYTFKRLTQVSEL